MDRRSAMHGESGYERRPGDTYNTESWVTEALLDAIPFRMPVWEPAAGRGDMVAVLRQRFGFADVIVSEIEGDRLGCVGAAELDFLISRNSATSIVTNPPYVAARRFIDHALALTRERAGMVAMLLRNEYDCAASRRDLFEEAPFAAKLVLTRRPRWLDDKGQHSASPRHNFAWFLWDHHHEGPPILRYLPDAR